MEGENYDSVIARSELLCGERRGNLQLSRTSYSIRKLFRHRDMWAKVNSLPALDSKYYETSQSAKFYKISQVTFFIPRKILKGIELARVR